MKASAYSTVRQRWCQQMDTSLFLALLLWMTLVTMSPAIQAAQLLQNLDGKPLGGPAGFGELAMARNDDGSSARIMLGSGFPHGLNFFGQYYDYFYINNNGNISFTGRVGSYTPRSFPASSRPLIAPYWADADTRSSNVANPNYNNIYYQIIEDEILITWYYIGYFKYSTNKLNAFQLHIKNRSEVAPGDFDVCFIYEQLQWTTGSASGGYNGLGGTPAQAGFDAGDGRNYYKHQDSMTHEVINLTKDSNVGEKGVWCFEIRSGTIREAQPEALTDVRITLTLPKSGIEIDGTTFASAPRRVFERDEQRIVIWDFETFSAQQIEDLGFDFIIQNPIPGERRRVTDSLEVRYRDVNNQLVVTEVGPRYVNVLPSIYDIKIRTDKTTYLVNEYAQITSPLINLSQFAQTAHAVEISVTDTTGHLVEQLTTLTDVALRGSEQKALRIPDFFIGTLYAGAYEVHAKVLDRDGEILANASNTFAVAATEGAHLTLNTYTDKPEYHTSDVVLIDNIIENVSLNVLMNDALLTLTIRDPNGQLIHTENQALNQLPPQGLQSLIRPYMLNKSPLGTYTVVAEITDAEGNSIQRQTQFEVKNDLKLAVVGEVKVDSKRLHPGQFQTCHYTLINQGIEDLTDLDVEYQLVNLDSGEVITSELDALSPSAESQQRTDERYSLLLSKGHYACVLQAQLEGEWHTLNFDTFEQTDIVASECSTVYAVHDEQEGDSRLFTYSLTDEHIRPLGPLYLGYDLEGLDIEPFTHRLYATSGKRPSRFYQVDGNSGELTPIGDLDFTEVESLSFRKDGTLWGWAREGLIQIDLDSGQGSLVAANDAHLNIEGLAWNNDGSRLYATGKPYAQENTSDASSLFVYADNTWSVLCNNLPGEVEGLEIRPDEHLVFGINDNDNLRFHIYDPNSCQSIADAHIITPYNDVEGIAWPNATCSATQLALRAFFTALSAQPVFIGEDGIVKVTLEGQIHEAQLDSEIIPGPAPANGQPQLIAIPDANGDGIDDFLFTAANGEQQKLYYLNIKTSE